MGSEMFSKDFMKYWSITLLCTIVALFVFSYGAVTIFTQKNPSAIVNLLPIIGIFSLGYSFFSKKYRTLVVGFIIFFSPILFTLIWLANR